MAAPKVHEESLVAFIRWRLVVILRLPWRESIPVQKECIIISSKEVVRVPESSVEESSKGGGHDTEIEKTRYLCAHRGWTR